MRELDKLRDVNSILLQKGVKPTFKGNPNEPDYYTNAKDVIKHHLDEAKYYLGVLKQVSSKYKGIKADKLPKSIFDKVHDINAWLDDQEIGQAQDWKEEMSFYINRAPKDKHGELNTMVNELINVTKQLDDNPLLFDVGL